MKGHDRRQVMLPVCIEAKDLANMKYFRTSIFQSEAFPMETHGKVASGEMVICQQCGFPYIQWEESFETETVKSSLWIPSKVR